MVEYTVSKKERKRQVGIVFFKSIEGAIIFLGIALLIAIGALIVGYIGDAAAVRYGYGLLGCIVLVAAILLIRYFLLIKTVLKSFKDEQIAVRFESNETEYVFTNITTGIQSNYSKSDVKEVKYYKNFIVLYYKDKRYALLPNTEEIRSLGQFDCLCK